MMNLRAEKLILFAYEFKKNPPESNMQIIQRAATILKNIYPDGSANISHDVFQILSPYLRYVEKTLEIQLTYENNLFMVKNIKGNYMQVLSELFEKEKMANEIEKRVLQSYITIVRGLNTKLDKIIQLMEQRPVEVEMKKEIPEKIMPQQEIGETEEKHLQPGAS
jgi:hypothetical protein